MEKQVTAHVYTYTIYTCTVDVRTHTQPYAQSIDSIETENEEKKAKQNISSS